MSDREYTSATDSNASFDGYQVRLRAPRDGVDHEVFLESSTLKAFLQFLDALPIKRPS